MTGEKNWEYIIFNFNSVDSPFVSLNYYPCNPQNVRNVKLDRNEIINMAYKGKKFCSFGDSIVELISWQKYVWKYLQFSTHYCRGIGGSKVHPFPHKPRKWTKMATIMPLIPKKELSLYRIICVVTADKYYSDRYGCISHICLR